MLTSLRALLKKWFQLPHKPSEIEATDKQPIPAYLLADHQSEGFTQLSRGRAFTASTVPFDENLLERSRTQWQFGDWDSLARLERDTLQHHPDRAKLALLAAAGHAQKGDSQAARQFTRLAQDWGCSKKLIAQILIAGVHNSLGRAAAASGKDQLAVQHLQASLQMGTPYADQTLLTRARVRQEFTQLGLSVPSTEIADSGGDSQFWKKTETD